MRRIPSPLQQRWRRILKDWVEPYLKSQGFTKRSYVYTKRLSEVWWLIDVQRSRWNTTQEYEFTMNLGVYVPGFYTILRGEDPERPTVADCVFNLRPNNLLGEQTDRWWVLRMDDEMPDLVDQAIGRELVGLLQDYGLPFLQRFQEKRAVLSYLYDLTDPKSWNLISWPRSEFWIWVFIGILHLMLEEPEAGCRALRRAVEEAKKSRVGGTVEYAQKLYGRFCSESTLDLAKSY